LTASPGVSQPDIALGAAAAAVVRLIYRELIAALGVETETAVQLGGYSAEDFRARGAFDELDLIDAKARCGFGAPAAPDIDADVRLPSDSIVAIDGPLAAAAR
jgi:hypothetical protein